MKTKTLSLLAGVGTSLILTVPAYAGLVRVKRKNVGSLEPVVIRVYAEFDNPGGDWMVAVRGTADAPLTITLCDATFYNNVLGSDHAPGTALIGVFPSLAYDSFYTIGIAARPAGVEDFLELVNMPPLSGTSVSTTNGGWALAPPTVAQGNPFDPVNSFPGDGDILIGQFSFEFGYGSCGIQGSFLLEYVSDGVLTTSYEEFRWVPVPGGLGLLGIAGLMGTRRRRRSTGPP